MKSVFGFIFIFSCFISTISFAKADHDRDINSAFVENYIANNFNPFDIPFYDLGLARMPGVTITANYAGSAYFFGVGTVWNNTSSASGSPDSISSDARIFPTDTTRYLFVKNFGFNIPCNASITNITLRVTRQNKTTTGVSCEDSRISIFNPYTLTEGALNLKDPNPWVEGGVNWETITYSHANWGETITPELLNDPRFGFIIEARAIDNAGISFPNVDAVEMEVCYTTLGPPVPPIIFVTEKVQACYDEGIITINAGGGTGSYLYSIDNGASFQSSNVFDSLALGEYIIIVKNSDNTCQTESFYCNLSGDDRLLQPGDAIVACATFPGNRVTLAVEKIQPFHDYYIAGETGYDVSGNIPNHPHEWKVEDLGGEVFSFDIDKIRNIYTGVTMLYDLTPGVAIIPVVSRIHAFTGQVTILDTLPGGAGVAGVEYDTICEQLFVANLDDGIIYRMDPNTGATLSTFDPLAADNGVPGIAPLGQRIMGMGFNPVENKLYYAMWNSDFNKTGIRNTIRSVEIDPGTCDFIPASDQEELQLPWTSEYGDPGNLDDFSMPVGDIEFNAAASTMLLAETGFDSDGPRARPHESRVLRYTGSSGAWTLQTTVPPGNINLQHELGEVSQGLNARGGVDFANSGINTITNCSIDNDEFIIATADALRGADCNTLGCIYGLQYLPVTGGNSQNSVLLDIARDLGSQQKSVFGDVDVIQGCASPLFCCPALSTPTPDMAECTGSTLGSITAFSQGDSVAIVLFNSVPADSVDIYTNGTKLDSAQIINGTATLNMTGFPVNTPGTYYVYLVDHPTSFLDYCRPYDSIIVTIFTDPVPIINDPADVCIDGADLNFTGSPLPGGGTTGSFSTDATAGLTDNGDGTAVLDIDVAGPGTFDVIYAFTDLNGCSVNDTASVIIYDLPTVLVTDPADVCVDGLDMSFTGTPAPGGGDTGVFSTTAPGGFTDNGDGTADLDVSVAGVGTYDVTYNFTTSDGCFGSATSSVTVNPLPVAGLNDPADECLDNGPMLFTGSPLPSGPTTGSFTTTAPAGLTDNGDGTASLDVFAAGPGTFDVTYLYTDANGCQDTETVSVLVYDRLPDVTFNLGQVCGDSNFGSTSIDLVSLITAGPTTGTWADTDASGGLSGSIFTADMSMEGNSYDFTYTITGPGPNGTTCQTRSFVATVNVVYCSLDLALIQTTSQSTPVKLTDVVTFDITICNQGFTIVDSVEVTEYLDSCYGFADNNGWTSSGSNAVITLTPGSGLPAGGLLPPSQSPDNCVTIPIDVSIDCRFPDQLINYAEVTASKDTGDNTEDNDSTPASNNGAENSVQPGDPDDDSFFDANEDDHDPATMPVVDVAMVMTTTTLPPYSYTQPIDYNIEVRNQGNIDLANVEISDYIPCGMSYASSNNPLWGLSGSIATTTIASLDAGETVNLSISLILDERSGACTDNEAWLNEAEVSDMTDDSNVNVRLDDIDSVSDAIQANDNGGVPDSGSDDVFDGDGTGTPVSTDPATDEDDSDPSLISVYDLQLTKAVTSVGPYYQDSVVSYVITITNQGSIDASGIEVSDTPAAGLVYVGSDAGANSNVTEIFPQVWVLTSLATQASETINVIYTVESNFQGLNLINRVQITQDDGDDIDSDPATDETIDEDGDGNGDDDDEDSQTVTVDQFYDLALTKTEFSTGPYYPGSLITYEIIVTNEGTFDANNIIVQDLPDADLSFDSDDTGADPNISSLGSGQYSITFLPNGTSVTFHVTYQVDGFYQLPDITNRAEIIVDDGADVDSDPDTGDTVDEDGDGNGDDDDEDLVTLTILQSYDLAITKTEVSSPPYLPGSFITYQLTVVNEGTLDASNIQISDTPSAELFYNTDNTGGNANITIVGPLIYEIGSLPAYGGTESIQITFQVDPSYMGYLVSNDTEIILDDGDDVDSDPSTGNTVDEDGDSDPFDDDEDQIFTDITQIYDLRIAKTIVGQNGILPGDNVTFQVQIFNEGTLDASNIEITERPDAELFYQSNTTGGNPNITEISPTQFVISSLPSGATETFEITYQVDAVTLELNVMNVIQITVDDGDDQDSDPDTDETVDEDGDGDGYDDDESSEVVNVLGSGEIGDYIWHDIDGDGIQDFNEPPLEGVEVKLYNKEGFFMDVRVTNGAGYYLFTEVFPGDYYIKVEYTDGFMATLPDKGGNDNIDSDLDESNGEGTSSLFSIIPGDLRYDIDGGLVKCAKLGDYVWFDYNENDRKDVFENGINQLKVEIWRSNIGTWVLWDETYTGPVPDAPSGDGYYKFCVIPGTYYLKFVNPPETLVPAVANQGLEDIDSDITGAFGPGTTNAYTVTSGEENCDIGAGFYEMGTVGDHVWFDNNENGMRDPGESGIEGVIVQAVSITGELSNVATTDASGNYIVDYLPKNTYYLQFEAPTGLSMTIPNQGSDESMDSDIDGSNGPFTTKLYNILPGEHLANIDAGFVSQALPVIWKDIWGEHRTQHNYIQWSVATEVNVSHYELLRSYGDQNNFTEIAKKYSVGNSNTEQVFQYEDFGLNGPGIYYYKVKQLDLDGRFSYSETIAILVDDDVNDRKHKLQMYPNPVINELTIETQLFRETDKLTVDIIDAIGRLVAKDILVDENLDVGRHIHKISVSELDEGVYTVKVSLDRYVINRKLIVIDN